MKQNVHKMDRVARVIFGIGILALAFFGPKSAWGYIGIIPLVTGLVGWCPFYKMLRIYTKPSKRNKNKPLRSGPII
jgi:hypothetical protein